MSEVTKYKAIRITNSKGKPWFTCLLIMGIGLLIAGLYYLTGIAFLRSILSCFIRLSGLNGMLQLILGSVIAVCWIAMILFSDKIVSYDTLLRQNFIRTRMKPCTL